MQAATFDTVPSRLGRARRRPALPDVAGVALARGSRSWWVAGLLLALVATVPAWLPWLEPRVNLWEVDDAKNHLLRFYHLEWLIARGVWYPRWVPDMFLGYGYPVLNYYAPAFYYLGLLLRAVLRLDFWDAYRATGVVAAAVGAGGAYALVVDVWRRASLGVLAALTLLYGPYVFQLNLYKRGDIPEALGLALLPWLLLALRRLWLARAMGQTAAWLAGAALFGAAEILVHNLTALLAALVAAAWVGYLLVARPRLDRLRLAALAGAIAVGVTAFFWLPAIGEGAAAQLEWLGGGGLGYRVWLLAPDGNTPRQQSAHNRQTRAGLIDLNLHYPHQLVAPPKLSLAQAGLGALAVFALSAALVRRGVALTRSRHGGVPLTPGPSPSRGEGDGPPPLEGERGATPSASARAAAWPPGVHSLPLPLWERGSGGEGEQLAPLVPLLLVAVGCWYLTFTTSIPVWEWVPGLPLLQFPWRLLGPLGVCLAVAGAGALAGPLAALERRWADRGRALGWALVALVAGAVLFNSLGDREYPIGDDPDRTIDGWTVVAVEQRDGLGLGTTSGREFLPREVQLATYTAGYPRGRDVFEWIYPDADWLGAALHPMGGDLRLLAWRGRPLRLSARVANDGAQAAALGIRQARFPGWRAWLDGRPAPLETAPYIAEQQAALGFIVVAVPPGEHTVDLAFGPTPVRVAGMGLTGATALGAAGALGWWLRRARRWPHLLLALGWLALAAGLAYLTWRGVRPAFLRFAALPLPAPAAVDGVWQAPDLGAGSARAGLVVNLAEAVRSGQARVGSPTGAALGPDTFVDVRQLTVTDHDRLRGLAGTSRREWLYLHPPSNVAVDVVLPARREVWLQAGLTLDPAVWEAPVGDGVRFQALVTPLDAAGREAPAAVVLDRTLNPRARTEQRRWVPVEADLSPWGGRTVRLTLRTLPGDDVSNDWSGWGNPVVVVRDTARTRPPATWE